MQLGVLSHCDIQADPMTGGPFPAQRRVDEIVDHAVLADRLGLDVFALGEHYCLEFAVSSPAVVLAAIAARTSTIRLTSDGRGTSSRSRSCASAAPSRSRISRARCTSTAQTLSGC